MLGVANEGEVKRMQRQRTPNTGHGSFGARAITLIIINQWIL